MCSRGKRTRHDLCQDVKEGTVTIQLRQHKLTPAHQMPRQNKHGLCRSVNQTYDIMDKENTRGIYDLA